MSTKGVVSLFHETSGEEGVSPYFSPRTTSVATPSRRLSWFLSLVVHKERSGSSISKVLPDVSELFVVDAGEPDGVVLWYLAH